MRCTTAFGNSPLRHGCRCNRRGIPAATRKLAKCIRAAANTAATIHLIIDAPALEHDGRSAMNSVARIIGEVGQLHARGMIRTETLGAAAARLSDLPVAKPQRSILSRAGA